MAKFSALVRAVQANFDHLMGVVRNLVDAHNLLVDDVEATDAEVEVQATITSVHTHSGDDGTEPVDPVATKNTHGPHVPPVWWGDGEDGQIGPPGKDGVAGAAGAAGSTGATGATGRAGIDGQDGDDGWQGPPGRDGSAGSTGSTGAAGADGARGVPGVTGDDGDDGWPGPPGPGPTTTGTRRLFLNPAMWEVDDATRTAVGATPDLLDALLFSEATGRAGAYTNMLVPSDWAGGAMTLYITWSTSSSTGDVRWLLSVSNLASGDSAAEASDLLAASGTTIADSTTIKVTSLGTFTPLGAADTLKLNIERNAGVGSDTATGNARIHNVYIEYTATGLAGPQGAAGAAGAAGGNHAILSATHTDSDSTDTPADGEVLTYDSGAAKWISYATGAGSDPESNTLGYPQLFKSFRAHLAGDQTITNNTLTTVTFDTEDWDDVSANALSGGVLTLPREGVWLIVAHVQYANGTTGLRMVEIQKNGTSVSGHGGSATAGADEHGVQAYLLDYFAASDTITIKTQHTQGANLAAKSGVNETWFAAIRLQGRRWVKAYQSADQTLTSGGTKFFPPNTEKYNPSGQFSSGALVNPVSNEVGVIAIQPRPMLVFLGAEAKTASWTVGGSLRLSQGLAAAAEQTYGGRLFQASQLSKRYSTLAFWDAAWVPTSTTVAPAGRIAIAPLVQLGAAASQVVLGGVDTDRIVAFGLGTNALWAFLLATSNTSVSSDTSFHIPNATGEFLFQTGSPYDVFTESGGVVTVPKTGKYLILATTGHYGDITAGHFPNSATGQRGIQIDKNSGTSLGQVVVDGQARADQIQQISMVVSLTAADTIALKVMQNSGSSANMRGTLFLLYLNSN